jgi:predicted DNA-binding protein (UPF0251 family)
VEQTVRDRQVRAARNQSKWREINELALTNKRAEDPTFRTFACECADDSCSEEISLTVEEYEAVRRRPDHFIVTTGHVVSDVERVVTDAAADGARYQIVEKLGAAGRVATERDPRAPG